MASNPFLELRQDDEEVKENPFLSLRKPPTPEMIRLMESEIATAHSPQVQLQNLPLPQITPTTHTYAASEPFADILRRYRDYGDEALTPEELGQIGAAVKQIPVVGEFVTAVKKLRSDIEKTEKEQPLGPTGERIPVAGEDTWTSWEKGMAGNLDKLPEALKNLYTTVNNWVLSDTEVEHTIGEPEFIPEAAELVAKKLIKWPADMGNMLYDEVKKHGPIVGPIRFGAGLLRFPFKVGTDIANMFGAGIPDITAIETFKPDWEKLYAEIPTSEQVIEQYKKDPTPIILVALPFLKMSKPHLSHIRDYYTLAKVERAEALMENVLDKKIKSGEVTGIEPYEGVSRRIGEKPKIEGAVEPQFAEIRKMAPGDLLTEALELQGKEGYRPAELAELYSLDREYVENIVSGGRIGKRPLSKEELTKRIAEKPKPKPEPEARKKPEEMTWEKYEAREAFDEARQREISDIEMKIMKNAEDDMALVKIQAEVYEAGLTRQEYLEHLRWRQEKESWEPTVKAKPKGEKEVTKPKEPVVTPEAAKIQKRIDQIEADIAQRETWLEEISDAKDRDAKEFALSIKKQIAEKQVELDAARQDLADLTEKPEPPPTLPLKPAVEPSPEPATARERAEPTKEIAKEEKPAEKAEELPAKAVEKPAKEPSPIPEAMAEWTSKVSEPFILKAEDVHVDPKRFQPRKDEFARQTVEAIKQRRDIIKLEAHPIVVWKDPAQNKYFVLEGHSRHEGMAYHEMPTRKVVELRGTEQEAISFAKESNFGTPHTIFEDVELFRYMRDSQKVPTKKLKAQWGDRYAKLSAYSYLNPSGKFVEYLSQEAWDSFPHLTQKARDVGEIRRDFAELTNRHEGQMFDAFYPTDSKSRRYLDMLKGDFRTLIERQVTDLEWSPNKPLKFGKETIEGLRARADTRETMAKIRAIKEDIKRVKKDKGMKGVTEYIQQKQAELDELIKLIEDYSDDQISLVLEEIKPMEKMSAGLGIVNPFKTMEQRLAERLKIIRSQREKALEGEIKHEPSFLIQRKPKQLGVSSYFRSSSNLFGAIEGQPARYGETAQAVARQIMLTDGRIMTEAGIRGEMIENILSKVDKIDWGKRGDKFYDYIVDPSRDGELQASSRQAAVMMRQVMESARQEIITRFRARIQRSVEKIVNKEWREARGLTGKKLNPAQKAELEQAIEAEIKNRVPDDWGPENYLPQMHFGNYDVKRIEMGPDGAPIQYHVGTGQFPAQALEKALDDYAAHPGINPEAYITIPRAFRGDEVMRVSRRQLYHMMEKIADAAEGSLGPQQVADFLRGTIGAKESRQKFVGFLQKRKGAPGYSKDLVTVLSLWNQQFTRWKHLTDLNRAIQPGLERIRTVEQMPSVANRLESDFRQIWGEEPTLATVLVDASIQAIPVLRDYIRPMALNRFMGYVKGGSVIVFIKANPRFNFLLNRLQRYQTTWPLLKGLPHTGEWLEGTRFYNSPEGKAAMEKYGVRHLTGGKILEAGRTWTKAKTREKLGTFAAETSNQEIAWCTMYQRAKKAGMTDLAAHEYAFSKGCLYSEFLYLRSDVPPAFRGPILSTAFQFKRFTVKNLELGWDLIADKNYAGAAKWTAAQILIGGLRIVSRPLVAIGAAGAAVGIPYAGKIGYLTKEAYEAVKEEYGDWAANFMAFGLPGLIGLDMSYSISMLDMAYGGSIPEQMGRLLLGPAGNLPLSIASWAYFEKGYERNPLRRSFNAAVQRMPALRWIEALDKLTRDSDAGKYDFRDPAGRLRFKGDIKDVIIRGLAGRTVKEGEMDIIAECYTGIHEQRDKVIDRTVMGIMKDLEAGRPLDLRERSKWNELWQEFPINDQALFDRLHSRYRYKDMDKIQRMFQHMPKVFRMQQMLEESEK